MGKKDLFEFRYKIFLGKGGKVQSTQVFSGCMGFVYNFAPAHYVLYVCVQLNVPFLVVAEGGEV